MKVKNWSDFQHFKDRTPPWIKLYRYLLDDPDWHELSGDDAKMLIMIWLIASEDKNMDGNLPPLKTLAFRLRISESKLKQSLNKLNNWLIQDDINVISNCHQLDIPETETETETEIEKETYSCANDFETFWANYPKKKSKGDALKAWKAKKPRIDDVMFALSWQKESNDWNKSNGQFIPYPASYLNSEGWKDEEPDNSGVPF